jgi:tripartite-type tricarboxylate transporter receptor subunit TctC
MAAMAALPQKNSSHKGCKNRLGRIIMKFTTRISLVGLLLGIIAVATPAQAQEFPYRPIRIVVPFAPGGSTDAVIRILANQLEKELSATVIVENRAGGAATIGMSTVAQSAPDGYVLGAANISFGANPSMLKALPYDTLKDFTPISLVARVPLVLAVHQSVPVNNVKEFIAAAKASPDTMTYSTAGHGSGSELSMGLFAYLTGLKLVNVPYNGGGPQVAGAVGGHVKSLFATIPAGQSHFASGILRPLGITTLKRDPTLPDVPPIAEAGVPDYEMGDWIGIVAAAKTPQPIVDKLNKAIANALKVPEVQARIEKIGTQVEGSTPEQFDAFIKKEIAKWTKVVDTMGLKIQ